MVDQLFVATVRGDGIETNFLTCLCPLKVEHAISCIETQVHSQVSIQLPLASSTFLTSCPLLPLAM